MNKIPQIILPRSASVTPAMFFYWQCTPGCDARGEGVAPGIRVRGEIIGVGESSFHWFCKTHQLPLLVCTASCAAEAGFAMSLPFVKQVTIELEKAENCARSTWHGSAGPGLCAGVGEAFII